MMKLNSEGTMLIKYEGNEKFVIIPDGVEKIRPRAFYKCNADIVYLPLSLKEIDERAFEKSKIITIMIPQNVEKIAKDAFKGCKFLYKIEVAFKNKNFDNNSIVEYYHGKRPSGVLKYHKFRRSHDLNKTNKKFKIVKTKKAVPKKTA